MQFSLNDKQKLLGTAAADRIESKALSLLAKFGDHVKSIGLTVEDINGPRGGIDKLCRVIVNLRRKPDVVITAKDHSLSKAITAAIDRASRSVGRRVDRRESRGKTRPLISVRA